MYNVYAGNVLINDPSATSSNALTGTITKAVQGRNVEKAVGLYPALFHGQAGAERADADGGVDAYTKVLCLICMLLMAAGLILILIGFAKTNAKKSVIKTVFAIILIIASECDLLWLYVNATEKLLGIIVF